MLSEPDVSSPETGVRSLRCPPLTPASVTSRKGWSGPRIGPSSHSDGVTAPADMRYSFTTLLTLLPVSLFSCGATDRDQSPAKYVGTSCELDPPPGSGELVVEVSNLCEEGFCLGVGPTSQGPGSVQCSCRCDSENDSGPFCRCPETHRCESVISELLHGSVPGGSYCVPR